jgi:hypothetical protein
VWNLYRKNEIPGVLLVDQRGEPPIDQSVVGAVTLRLDRIAIPARSRASRLTHARSARSRIVTWPSSIMTWASATAPAPWVPRASTRSVASGP